MTPEDRVQIYQEMVVMPGPTMDLVVSRSMETIDRDGLGVTISQEALEQLSAEMTTWVGTRILRQGEETGIMPQSLKVTLTVSFT